MGSRVRRRYVELRAKRMVSRLIIHYCCHWSVSSNWRFTACLMTFCASHTDGYPYLATSYQRSVNLPGTVLRVPIPYGWVLSVSGRSVDLSGLTSVFMVTCVKFEDWRGKCRCTDETTLLYAPTCLARTHCACLPRSSLPRTITSCYCTVAC